ncbi:hypothetical protein, partial [Delftia acidovorans]|uniref:hypothetical protein n=1 Tax=Delftia acidovorans TaxID=80866 RepID=UPI0028A70F50
LPKDRLASSSDLPQLFERSAPARSEFCGTPRIPPNAGRPQRSEGSWAVRGALLCPAFLSRDKKAGRPPGRNPASKNNHPAGAKTEKQTDEQKEQRSSKT